MNDADFRSWIEQFKSRSSLPEPLTERERASWWSSGWSRVMQRIVVNFDGWLGEDVDWIDAETLDHVCERQQRAQTRYARTFSRSQQTYWWNND